MEESNSKQEPSSCLCDRVKDPRTIDLNFSEPVCGGCHYDLGSNPLKLELQRKYRELLNDRKRKLLELTNSLPSTSGTASQQKQPINSLSSMLVFRPSARNSSMAREMLCKVPISRFAAKPGLPGSCSLEEMERFSAQDPSGNEYAYKTALMHSSASAIATLSLTRHPTQVSESQNSSNPNHQQQSNQYKLALFVCWNCKQREMITMGIQCPAKPDHIFCYVCTDHYIWKCMNCFAATHCPDGHTCISSVTGMLWRFPPKASSIITTAEASGEPQVLEQQSSSNSSPNQQGNQNETMLSCCKCYKFQLHRCKNACMQCPIVPKHVFCIPCAEKYVKTELLTTGIYCPSGKECASSELDIPWKFTKAQLQRIESFNGNKRKW